MLSGGRVTKAIVKVIQFFKIKPIILLDGKNHYAGMGKNYQTIVDKIIQKIDEDYDHKLNPQNIKMIGLYYAGYDDVKKNYIINKITNFFKVDASIIKIMWVPTVILAHVRKDAYGIMVAADFPRKIHNLDDDK